MPAITLTSDRRSEDFYLGRVKGQLLTDCPSHQVIDLAHNISLFSLTEAAFILKNSYNNFPEGTIHIIGVDAEENSSQAHYIVKAANQYFICADNGIFSLIFDENVSIQKIVKITNCKKVNSALPAMIKFAKVAKRIIENPELDEIGETQKAFKRKFGFSPASNGTSLTGRVVYIDSYKNVITNITREIFSEAAKEREFTIYVGSNRNTIHNISESYIHIPAGVLLAKFNSLGLLEIALNKGQAADLFGLTKSSEIRINFHD